MDGRLASLGPNQPMTPALALLVLVTLPQLLAAPDVGMDSGGGGGGAPRTGPQVLLVRTPGMRAVQEVTEAFSEGVRVQFQQVSMGDSPSELARTRELAQSARLLVAIGQPALELLVGARAHIVYALAPDPPSGAIGTNTSAPPVQVFRALQQLRPKTHRILAISSERGHHRVMAARGAARSLGMELIDVSVTGGDAAIRALRELFLPSPEELIRAGGPPSAGQVDAIWLGADPQLINMQVLQFVLRLQIQRGVPVIAATRQQVYFGAMMAVDWPPEAVGRHLAWQVNQLLHDPAHMELVARDHPSGNPEIVVNAHAARRLGIRLERARHNAGWKVVER